MTKKTDAQIADDEAVEVSEGEPVENTGEPAADDAVEVVHGEVIDPEDVDFDLSLGPIEADFLRGDIRDSILGWFRVQPKAWGSMSEVEQRLLADAVDRYAARLLSKVCQVVAATDRPYVVATLVEYKEKNGVEAKLKLPSKVDVIAALHEACGGEVLIVTSGVEEFSGQRGDAQIDANQIDMFDLGREYTDADGDGVMGEQEPEDAETAAVPEDEPAAEAVDA